MTLPKWGAYLRNEWENNFAKHLTQEEKDSIYLNNKEGYCGYLWHLFSYEKKGCVIGGEALKSFDNQTKSVCYIFEQHSDYALILENASEIKACDIPNGIDIYVVDKEFNWTFIKTHEADWCGPYFSKNID